MRENNVFSVYCKVWNKVVKGAIGIPPDGKVVREDVYFWKYDFAHR